MNTMILAGLPREFDVLAVQAALEEDVGARLEALVQQAREAAGLDPAAFARHSLRSGFLTSAAEAGADVLRMMEVSRHKRVETMQGYVRRASLFKGHAGAGFL